MKNFQSVALVAEALLVVAVVRAALIELEHFVGLFAGSVLPPWIFCPLCDFEL